MKLNLKAMRYLTVEDWRVLTGTEMGSRNHEVVPTPLILQLSNLRGGSGVHKSISTLAKADLIARVKNASYDGYRLTYGGIDYLALNAHRKSDTVYSVGNQIGVGKESDIYVVASHTGTQHVLKIHRLGRISFRTVKANRDYLRGRSSGSWMYMSRLAALKEFTFMKVLRDNGFPVPEPIAWNRHTIVMSLINAFPLRQISKVPDPASLYGELMEMIIKLASYGLIHGDFNEFNILIEERPVASPTPASTSDDSPPEISLHPVLIDFPQMVSTSHPQAEFYFDRDVECIKRFFSRRFHFTSDDPGPFLKDATVNMVKQLDIEAQATGFSKKQAKELEKYMKEMGVDGDGEQGDGATVANEDANEDADVSGDEEEESQEVVLSPIVQSEEIPPASAPSHRRANDDPNIPDTTLATSFTVLDISDLSQPNLPTGTLPAVAPSIAPTNRTMSKKDAGWAI